MDGTAPRQVAITVLCVGTNLGLGGAERHWLTLLPRLLEHGIAPQVLCVEREGRYAPELRGQDIPVVAAQMRGPLDVRGWRRALATGLRARPDVIMTVGTVPECVGRPLARLRRLPHVVNEHRGAGLVLARRERAAQRLLAPGATRVIAVAEDQVEALVARGYRRDRVRVIHNAVDARRLEPQRSRDAVRSELDLGPQTTAVLCASSLRREKRVDLFCRAVAHARDSGADVIGIVAGDGPEREQVAAAADPEAIRLLGLRDDIGDLLAAADVACSSSAVEAQSLFLLEAQAAGLPLVATAVGGSPEIALHGRAGLLVPPDDLNALAQALAAVAEDSELRERLAAGAREAQRHAFGIDDMASAYAELLLSVVRHRA